MRPEGEAVDDSGLSEREDSVRSRRTRDHLANERTFLAWIRTAGAVMALGLVIARFTEGDGAVPAPTLAAGVILVVVGTAGLVYGGWRYRRVNREIERSDVVTGTRGVEVLAAGAVLAVAMIVALVLVVA